MRPCLEQRKLRRKIVRRPRSLTVILTCVTDLSKTMEEALHCEGSCGQHLHRYCASVSKYHYLELKNNSSLVVCLICTQGLHRAEVQDLQSVVAALKDELHELCTGLLCLLKQAAPVVASPSRKTLCKCSRRKLRNYSLP